jgi:hypothetical protein
MDQWMPFPPVAQVPRLEQVMEVFDFLLATLRSHEAAAGVGLAVQYPAQ